MVGRARLRPLRGIGLLPLLGGALALVGCGKTVETVSPRQAIPTVAPTAVAALPAGIKEATITVSGGTFDVDQVTLLRDQPTVLHVVNHDNRAYRFRIRGLVNATPIAAGTTTNVGFTTPKPAVDEGDLLPASGDAPLDTVRVVVQEASGIKP